MNIGSFLKTVGVGLISANPMGAAAIGLINAALPDDKKIPITATGVEAEQALDKLSPEQKQSVMLANIAYDVKVLETDSAKYAAMCAADGQVTRAKVVMWAMKALIGISLIFILATAWVYVKVGAVEAFNPAMIGVYVSITGTFAYVIRAYFGDLRRETESRHQMIDNKPRKPGVVETLFSRK